MIRKRFPNSICTNQFRHLGDSSMAATSNFILGQRDFELSYLRRFSQSTSTSSAVDVTTGSFLTNGFMLKGCCSGKYVNILRNNYNNNNNLKNGRAIGKGVQKARVYGRVSEEAVKVEDQQKSLNSRAVIGGGAANRGNFTEFLDEPFQEKTMVAVDVDEVLGNFISALNHIWNCSRDEADIRVHEFFKTHYFKKGIYPIPGAREALQKLSENFNLSIVTSRQNTIKEHTLESLGAKVLIDDNPRYAIECAEVGIKVLLFDYENSYPWCKSDNIPRHPLVTKVHNWHEVEHQLASWVVS
ncbi:hypothetical protein OROHE_006317 [Orobanche hederae]